MHISTEITIKAPKEKVWDVLTDMGAYPDWNPFIKLAEGQPNPGQRLKIHTHMPNGKKLSFAPKVLVAEKNKELRWLGKLGIKGLFDGEHIFELSETETGQTKLIHREEFSGILVPFFKSMLQTQTKQAFVLMNEALKKRAEAK